MPKFILRRAAAAVRAGRFVLSDAPPAADNRNLLEKAAQWASDTLEPTATEGSAIGGVMAGMADPVAGLVQMGATFRRQVAGRRFGQCGHRRNEAEYDSGTTGGGRSGFDACAPRPERRSAVNVIVVARVHMAGYARRSRLALLLARSALRLTRKKTRKILVEEAAGRRCWRSCWRRTGACRWRWGNVSQMWNGRGTPPLPTGTPRRMGPGSARFACR